MAGATMEDVIDDAKEADHTETKEDSYAEGIIKGLHDFKKGRFTRLKTPEELAEQLLNL